MRMVVKSLTLARNAMATRFEFVLAGDSETQLRAAGEEACEEIERIESRLSIYRPGSDIAQINARAGAEPVRVSPEVFALLIRAREFSHISGGTFDPTIGPLVRCWGFMKGNGSRPGESEISLARQLVGMDQVVFDQGSYTIQFSKPGMMLDLGSIGKGYALDCAAEILREAGVEKALLHGGTSTILALGTDAESQPWKVAIENPRAQTDREKIIAVVELSNQSLSVSAVWGKYFEMDGKLFSHVLDPRTGWPAENVLLGAAILPSATASDALSTAVLLGRDSDLNELVQKEPQLRYLQMKAGLDTIPAFRAHGISRI